MLTGTIHFLYHLLFSQFKRFVRMADRMLLTKTLLILIINNTFASLQAICRSSVDTVLRGMADWRRGELTVLTKINIPSGAFHVLLSHWTCSPPADSQQPSWVFVCSLARPSSLLHSLLTLQLFPHWPRLK